MEELKSMNAGPMQSRLQIPPPPDDGAPRYINFGAGTTGTRFLFDLMCNVFNISGTHFRAFCNGSGNITRSTISSNWSFGVYDHMVSEPPMWTRYEMKALTRMVQEMLDIKNGGSFWTDSPVPQIFVDLISLIPRALSMATYRDPNVWAQRRTEEHSLEYMCHPKLWHASGVLHPYDFIGCLNASRHVSNAFIFIKNVTKHHVKSAYVKMNTVNAYHALVRNINFLPVCLFDAESSSVGNVTLLLERHGVKRARPRQV